jgi:hypothetical protein
MSQPQPNLEELERSLGTALALIHRALPRLDEPGRAAEVQSALSRAASLIEGARAAHAGTAGSPAAAPADPRAVATTVDAEIAAAIAAAVSIVFAQPYRLVSVQKIALPVPYVNVWALEGRTEIFQSHRVR